MRPFEYSELKSMVNKLGQMVLSKLSVFRTQINSLLRIWGII